MTINILNCKFQKFMISKAFPPPPPKKKLEIKISSIKIKPSLSKVIQRAI